MYTKQEIMKKLKDLQNDPYLKGYKFGLAGSYVRGEETKDSDIDIITDKDMLTLDQLVYIDSKFDCDVDIVQLPLLKQEDEDLDKLFISIGCPINEYSAYKSIIKEVEWCG